ncbi:MAG: bifunctional phosphoglucose/phosphomannose isomerase [Nanoarchaeota archaeon]
MLVDDLKNFTDQIEEASKIGLNVKIRGYDKIFVCGMGGSAISGDILRDCSLLNSKIPVFVYEENLPAFVNSKSIVFIVSYSGNTKETIRMYKEAKSKKAQIFIITSGGYLSKKKGAVIVPSGMFPRSAIAYLLLPILNILKINYDKKLIISSVKSVRISETKKLAKEIKGKTPVIYATSERYKSVAYRWETQFNENSKIIAHSNFLPEINHNEVESHNLKKFKFIFICESKKKILSEKFFKPFKLYMKGKNQFARMFYAIHFGDWTSYFLGRLNKFSFEVNRINFIKMHKNERKILYK